MLIHQWDQSNTGERLASHTLHVKLNPWFWYLQDVFLNVSFSIELVIIDV